MLFFKKDIKHKVWLAPSNIERVMVRSNSKTNSNPIDWKECVREMAWSKLEEDSFVPDVGYVVDIIAIRNIEKLGIILPLSGMVEHNLTFDAIILFPIQGEVIDVEVVRVRRDSIIFSYMNLVYGIVSDEQFPIADDYDYQELERTEIEDELAIAAGSATSTSLVCIQPSNVSDSKEIAPEYKWQSLTDKTNVIRKGSVVRVRVIRRAYGQNGFWIQGSMQNKYLGLRKGEAPLSAVKKKKHEIDLKSLSLDNLEEIMSMDKVMELD